MKGVLFLHSNGPPNFKVSSVNGAQWPAFQLVQMPYTVHVHILELSDPLPPFLPADQWKISGLIELMVSYLEQPLLILLSHKFPVSVELQIHLSCHKIPHYKISNSINFISLQSISS
jgi:hypothetical protein